MLYFSVSTDVLYLTNTKSIDHYKGNYDNFEKTYEELTKNKIREYEAQQQLREHTQVSFTLTLNPTSGWVSLPTHHKAGIRVSFSMLYTVIFVLHCWTH